MFLADLSIKRPVMISMIMIALALFGVLAYMNIPLNLMPDAKIPYVTIQTVYVGASPEQIESLITEKIEDEVGSISLLKEITSYSLNSASLIILEFELEKDQDIAFQDTKEKVDAIVNDLPAEAEAPVVQKIDISATPIMGVMISGDIDPTELYYIADEQVKERLSQINGVGNVDVEGGFEREIRVEFDNKTVYENSISLSQISGILAAANLDMPGGNFQNQGQDYAVSLEGKLETTTELEEMRIPTATGMRKLGQLADISDSSEDVRERVTLFNTKDNIRQDNTVQLSIVKSPEGNPVEVANEVKRILPRIREELPESVNLTITFDDSTFIEDTANDTINNIILGIIFTAAILLFFLHDLRSTLIVALSMPLSIIPTFLIMRQLGITMNIMSLMGLSTSVGTLVMNSVVVLENIFRHKNMGHPRKEAASKGTGEVAVAVIASAMTNICVFVPLGTMGGMVGIFIGDFALTVVIATVFSLIIAFTLTPMLASLLLPEEQKKKMKISRAIEGFFENLEKRYAVVLEKILHNRLRSVMLIAGTIVLFVISLWAFRFIPFEFSPAMDSGKITIEVELPQDASLEQTAELIKEVENTVASFSEVEQIVSTLGSLSSIDTGTNLTNISVTLIDKTLRDDFSVMASRIGVALADIPDAVFRVRPASSMAGGDSAPVQFYLQGNDMDELILYTEEMKAAMARIPGATGISSSMKSGKPEIKIYPNRQNLADLGVTVQELAYAMYSAVDGMVTTQFKESGREYDIRVTLRDTDVSSYESIRNIPIATPSGIYPLSFFAEIEIVDGVNKLLRISKQGSVEITSNLLPGTPLGNVTGEVDRIADEILPEGVKVKWGGDADMMQETMINMAQAFIIAILLTYMVLAGILEKIGQPLLILSTVPLSLIGIIGLFLIRGDTMNMPAMMAIIMLVGMVVNNAILILEYTNQLRKEGLCVRDALLKACPTKLQPILMANIATILGMLPMALGIGASGAEMRQPMGLVSIGGLLTATFLTLFVIPALENAIESRKEVPGACADPEEITES